MKHLTPKSLPVRRLLLSFSLAVSTLLLPVSGGGEIDPVQPAVQAPLAEAAAVEPTASGERLEAGLERRTPKVGIQVGHWRPWDAPEELRVLRTSIGAFRDDWGESLVNMDVSKRVAKLLEVEGVEVELLPVTVPPDYTADLFISIHGDANPDAELSGFKMSHSIWSAIPELEDQLVGDVVAEYEAATGLKEHRETITGNMLQYYAFNRKFRHTVHPGTPAVIFEMGFLTNEGDRKLLLEEPDRVAGGISRGILRFLDRQPRANSAEDGL